MKSIRLVCNRWLLLLSHCEISAFLNGMIYPQPLGFYDTWVARDSDGNLFLKKPPYVTDPYSLQRVKAGVLLW